MLLMMRLHIDGLSSSGKFIWVTLHRINISSTFMRFRRSKTTLIISTECAESSGSVKGQKENRFYLLRLCHLTVVSQARFLSHTTRICIRLDLYIHVFSRIVSPSRPELLEQLWKARAEKKKLRKTIREFEEDFYQRTGRWEKDSSLVIIDQIYLYYLSILYLTKCTGIQCYWPDTHWSLQSVPQRGTWYFYSYCTSW